MEDMERKNAMQYVLMVYLDEKRWAKMPEETRTSECRSKRRSYPPQSSESRPVVAVSNSALLERP